jgi:ATP-binding protein involved in chromosome partitioning
MEVTGPVPTGLKQKSPSELEICWSDGQTRLYPVRELRLACPCALCVDETSGRRILDPSQVPQDIRPIQITPVGRYALNVSWTDGHHSGIYTFETLRKLGCCRSS